MAVPTTPNFEHTELPDGQIRLLKIVSEKESNNLELRLDHFVIGSQPFAAISYRWDSEPQDQDPSDTQVEVTVNDKIYKIRPNAWRVLKWCRYHERHEYLWLDALCVNQDDVHQRSAEVQQMDKIYSRAEEVIVYIHIEDASVAEKAFRYLQAPFTLKVPRIPVGTSKEQLFNAVKPILENEYWWRTWIVQEIILASSITLMCGEQIADWNTFAKFLTTKSTGILTEHPGQVLQQLRRETSQQRPSLRDLIKSFAYSHCYDVRDKIFGMAGMYNMGRTTGRLQADYSLCVEDLLHYTLICVDNDDKDNGWSLFNSLAIQRTLGIDRSLTELERWLHARRTKEDFKFVDQFCELVEIPFESDNSDEVNTFLQSLSGHAIIIESVIQLCRVKLNTAEAGERPSDIIPSLDKGTSCQYERPENAMSLVKRTQISSVIHPGDIIAIPTMNYPGSSTMTIFGLIVLRPESALDCNAFRVIGCVYFDQLLDVFAQLEVMAGGVSKMNLSLDRLTAIAFSTMRYHVNQPTLQQGRHTSEDAK